jgi:predicted AlkP superfamily pyrophosphatase or phosphodiesterase
MNGLTRHVILVSIDGLRPDAIAAFKAPTLSKLIEEGSYTLSATTILPSKTLPSHTSMLSGQPPSVHGVSWNRGLSLNRKSISTPTVFGVLHSLGYVTAAFFSKAKFGDLQKPGTLDYSQAPGGLWGAWSAERTLNDIDRYLASELPHFMFIHLAEVDRAGHDSGWMSEKYGNAVRVVDAAIARLLTTAETRFGSGAFTLIVTSDHGGHNRDHGSDDPRDVTIPWIAWGKGVQPGEILQPVKTVDTASTVLWMFRVPETDWAGEPITAAFQRLAD